MKCQNLFSGELFSGENKKNITFSPAEFAQGEV